MCRDMRFDCTLNEVIIGHEDADTSKLHGFPLTSVTLTAGLTFLFENFILGDLVGTAGIS